MVLSSANPFILPGMIVTSGAVSVPANTYVTAVSGTSVTLSASVTAATAVNFNFVGYPEVLLKWNQGYHAYQVPVAI